RPNAWVLARCPRSAHFGTSPPSDGWSGRPVGTRASVYVPTATSDGRAQPDHRDLAVGGAVLVGVVAAVHRRGLAPQPLAILALGLPRDVHPGAPSQEELHARVRAEVVEPGRLAGGAAG